MESSKPRENTRAVCAGSDLVRREQVQVVRENRSLLEVKGEMMESALDESSG